MLLNKNSISTESHVEFVSYSGKWPNLCGGILILKIDGKEVKFGSQHDDKTVEYPRFWKPCPDAMSVTTTGEWGIVVDELPEDFLKYAAEIDTVFNENVEYGHCSGCR